MADLGSLLGSVGLGGAIGKAIVSLELETTKYNAELKAAQAQTVASTNASSATLGRFSSVAAGAWTAVGAAAVAGAVVSVKAAIEANDAQLKLQNTFENNPRLADSSVEAFTRQADALRDLTGVDDEAIISSQAMLGQFELTGKEVEELTPLIVDLSAKMGIDLETAVKAVGKATQGNTGSLARYGIAIDETDTKAEAFTATVEGLGVAQGFAADRAEQEPWRVLGAQFEEIAEQVGQALLPAIQNLAELLTNLLPILSAVAGAIQYLPLFQMAEGFESDANAAEKFGNALLDTIPILGSFTDITGDLDDELGGALAGMVTGKGIVETLSDAFRDRLSGSVEDTRKQVVQFAHMTSREIKEWSDDVKGSFDDFVLVLDESAEATKITRREFINATDAMQREARQLARAMREIADEKWVNDEYIAFLSEQGPEWLIGFANLTETEQRRAQRAWKDSTDKTDEAKESLDRITGVLGDLDKGESKHKVIIEYDYVGFDPSKPGMSNGSNNTPSETRRP